MREGGISVRCVRLHEKRAGANLKSEKGDRGFEGHFLKKDVHYFPDLLFGILSEPNCSIFVKMLGFELDLGLT